jgi:hypothetical protein
MSTAAAPTVERSNVVNRREFLHYVWGAGAALLAAESCGAITWFALPHERFGFGQAADLFKFDPRDIPALNGPPYLFVDAGCWLSNLSGGLLVLSRVCVHDPTLFKWVPTNNRFECPSCGSKFRADGTFIEGQGPAQRDLDRFVVQVRTPNGTLTALTDGGPVEIQGATEIVVDVKHKILGKPRSQHTVFQFSY